jgi:phage terminase large subunit-like protein
MIASAYDHRRDVESYIEGVCSGEIVTGRLVRLAVERHVADLEHAVKRGFYFDDLAAESACQFFPELLVHSIGRWDKEPFELSPWQKFCMWCIFGWKEIDTRRRRFLKAFISIARKNGKTTFAAGIPILCMYCDDPPEPGAELYCCATKEEQALKLWRETERMIRKSPQLRALTKFRHKRIIFEELDSFFTPLGSDSDSTDGLNPHVVVKDELHAWQERHRGLHGKLSTGSGAREQPLEIIITTAGDDRSTIWIEEDDYATKVVEGPINGDVIDDRLFAFVARIDDEDNPFDEEVWIKANPNLEVSVFTEKLRIFANTAQQDPSKYSDFVRYYCNRRVTSSERAVKAELWAEAKGVRPNESDFDRVYIHAGFDLGRADDFASVGTCEAFHKDDDLPVYFLRSRSFTCKDSPMAQSEPCRSWIRNELIDCHDGNSVDFNDVQRFILDEAEDRNPATWAYDETFAKQMAQSLFNEHGLQIFKFTQAPTFYNEPVREFLKALADGRIIHEGDPVLTWQALNLTIKRNASDQWMPDKSNPKLKIDAMVALLMAFSECLFAEKQRASFYDRNSLEIG